MAGFKKSQPGLSFSGEQVTPDEIDQYYVYQIVMPSTSSTFLGTFAVAGTSATGTYVVVNRYPDYPRNIQVLMKGSAAGMTGTFVGTGYDQFGSPITESIAITAASNGGTTLGTKVWGRLDSGAFNFGTAVGNGTVQVGFGTTGTSSQGTLWFGLPVKIAGTSDISLMSINAGTGAVTWNGGSVSAYIGTALSAVTPPASYTLTGTEVLNVWIKSSYNPTNIQKVSNLKIAA